MHNPIIKINSKQRAPPHLLTILVGPQFPARQAVSCALNLDPQYSAWLLVLACKACGSHFTAGSASTRNSSKMMIL
jgi:hypothetical protein